MIHLLIFQDGSSRNIELTESFYSIGRSPSCDIQITSRSSPLSISRHHAHLVRVGMDTYNIQDGSRDGTLSKSGIFIRSSADSPWLKKTAATLRNRDCIMFPPDVIVQYSTCCAEVDSNGTVY